MGREMTTEQIRSRIAELIDSLRWDDNGLVLPEHQAARDEMYALAAELQQSGRACYWCAYGQWDKHARCKHE